MRVIRKVYSQKSPIRRGELELFEFLGQRRACDWNLESACSDVRALVRGIRNVLLTMMPLWMALVWFLAR
jgi:hypothetical protein